MNGALKMFSCVSMNLRFGSITFGKLRHKGLSMPTQKQLDAVSSREIYMRPRMEEIKVRIQFIENAIAGRYFMPNSQLVRES